jgi:hypothetical protein
MRLLWLTCVSLAGGCSHGGGGGGNADIAGMYQTLSDNQDTSGCGPGMPVAGSYFRIESANLLGDVGYTFEECAGPDPMTCLSLGALSFVFDTPVSGGWRGDAYEATPIGVSDCAFTDAISTAVFQADGTLRVEFRHTKGQTQGGSVPCTTAGARQVASSFTCVSDEVIIAKRLK